MTKLTGKAKARARKKAQPSQKVTKNNKKGFRPDAGLNSQEGTNYYWFQVTDFLRASAIRESLGSGGASSYRDSDGDINVIINTPVDIMDEQGTKHVAPQMDEGYFATFDFTAELFEQMADQIDKGALSIRVKGEPWERDTSNVGESFRTIKVRNTWSQGNPSGKMNYIFNGPQGMINTDSKELSKNLRRIVADAVA